MEVVSVPARNAYEVRLDGATVGEEPYPDQGAHRVFYATEVDPAFGGRRLGSILIHDALADIHRRERPPDRTGMPVRGAVGHQAR